MLESSRSVRRLKGHDSHGCWTEKSNWSKAERMLFKDSGTGLPGLELKELQERKLGLWTERFLKG